MLVPLYPFITTNPPKGNYLSTPTLTSVPVLTYFPSSALPLDPAARFGDLFVTRPRWRASEIAPFLVDCAVDAKDRDKLLLKFARAVTEGKDVFYTARATYNG
jgi:sister chromatid cohesion protein DCC1